MTASMKALVEAVVTQNVRFRQHPREDALGKVRAAHQPRISKLGAAVREKKVAAESKELHEALDLRWKAVEEVLSAPSPAIDFEKVRRMHQDRMSWTARAYSNIAGFFSSTCSNLDFTDGYSYYSQNPGAFAGYFENYSNIDVNGPTVPGDVRVWFKDGTTQPPEAGATYLTAVMTFPIPTPDSDGWWTITGDLPMYTGENPSSYDVHIQAHTIGIGAAYGADASLSVWQYQNNNWVLVTEAGGASFSPAIVPGGTLTAEPPNERQIGGVQGAPSGWKSVFLSAGLPTAAVIQAYWMRDIYSPNIGEGDVYDRGAITYKTLIQNPFIIGTPRS